MGPTALRGFRAMGDTLSNVESQVFTPYNFGSSRDRTPNLLTTRPKNVFTTQPWLTLTLDY